MIHPPIYSSDREQRLDEVLASYLQAVRSGQAPTRQELLESHPDLARELSDFFADQDQFDCLAAPLRTLLPVRPEACRDRALGPYELLEEIARGGMGVIYKARHQDLKRIVALKMLRAGRSASAIELRRFRAEAEAAADLDHPNIVPIFEVGEQDGQPYFCMRLMEGSLAGRGVRGQGPGAREEGARGKGRGAREEGVRGQGSGVSSPLGHGPPLGHGLPTVPPSGGGGISGEDQRWAAGVMEKVARAVHYAHQRGLLHRDLKPANILLDARGEPHVSDFGLAKRVDPPDGHTVLPSPALTHSGTVLGTPSYMAPEQAAGDRRAVTTAADVYSLGAILYELLTGQPPFRGETLLDTIWQVQQREPVPPHALVPGVDRDLETICLKCLEKEPGKRYASAEEVAEELRRFLAGESILARPAGPLRRCERWCRRNPLLAILAAALFLSLTGGLGVSLWLLTRAQAAGQRAEENFIQAQTHLLEAQANLEEAERQRERAEENFGSAHQAVDLFCTRASEELGKIPGTQAVRKKLLEAGLAYYEKFLQQHRDDPKLRTELAVVSWRMAAITSTIGSPAEALAAFERTRTLLEELQTAYPNNPKLLADLARTHNRIGILHAGMGHQDAALQTYQRARDLFEQLLKDRPHDPDLLTDLAAVENNLANLLRSAGKITEARVCFERDCELMSEMVRLYPTDPRAPRGLAVAQLNLADLQASTGQRDEASRTLEAARERIEQLAKADPSNPQLQRDLARAYRQSGGDKCANGRPAEAVGPLREGQAVLEKLVAANPGVIDYQTDLATNHRQLGHALRDSGQRAEALDHYRQARDLLEPLVRAQPALTGLQSDLARSHYDLGGVQALEGQSADALCSYQRALELRRALVKASPDRVDWQCDLGMTLNKVGSTLWNRGWHADGMAAVHQGLDINRSAFERAPGANSCRSALRGSYDTLTQMEKLLGHTAEAEAAALERDKLGADK
jgi:serine/threonine protein kinase/predicted Zn-dependent protease